MIFYMLQSEMGWYKKGQSFCPRWVKDPQDASVWTNLKGPAGARGRITRNCQRTGVDIPLTWVMKINIPDTFSDDPEESPDDEDS